MRTAFDFCLPTAAKVVPDGPDWIHEIKYDGYRLRIERNGRAVRLLTKNGHDWTRRFPWIVAAALKNREQQFVVDGEAVVLGVHGSSDSNALHSRKHDDEVQLHAFDVLALGGEDLRSLPLSMRKTKLAKLLRSRPEGMFVAPLEPGAIGPDLFGASCRMGLEGLVSKRKDRRYSAGRSRDWIKVKNRTHPAMTRVQDSFRWRKTPAVTASPNDASIRQRVNCHVAGK
ncbi:RNA ligase family protein [Bradyrhizobium sp. 76]|jgi:ATP-dependent DNA ligase|uniref:ATP-dependent DNA ligase n=1 Tax=Bradyrhizobium sp. 76 TaxID=2782680 RepID=UPI001FF86D51|nr:RNA ligase family protein [Bradyrhizobium sp. 76]MCK1405287.1 DNA ligase [Bradyrhizobium sp. 76]